MSFLIDQTKKIIYTIYEGNNQNSIYSFEVEIMLSESKNYPKTEKHINKSSVLDRIKSLSKFNYNSPSLLDDIKLINIYSEIVIQMTKFQSIFVDIYLI